MVWMFDFDPRATVQSCQTFVLNSHIQTHSFCGLQRKVLYKAQLRMPPSLQLINPLEEPQSTFGQPQTPLAFHHADKSAAHRGILLRLYPTAYPSPLHGNYRTLHPHQIHPLPRLRCRHGKLSRNRILPVTSPTLRPNLRIASPGNFPHLH